MLTISQAVLGDTTSDVKALQNALKALALKKNNPAMDPGTVDGYLGANTLRALAASVGVVPGMPSWVKTLLQIGPGAVQLLDPSAIQSLETSLTPYAKTLAVAIQAATALSSTGSGGGTPGLPGSVAGTIYPAGTIVTFSKGMWRVAIPIGTSLHGAGFSGAFSGAAGLGATYTEVAPSATQPPGTTPVGKLTFAARVGKLASTPLFWGLTAGGAAIVGLGIATVVHFVRK